MSTPMCGQVDRQLYFKSKADMKVKKVNEIIQSEKMKEPRMNHWGALMSAWP